MSRNSRTRFILGSLLMAAIAAIFAYYVSEKPMDFRVYHYGARGVFDGTRPVYGDSSGLGWPMHYRYPPLFLLLFAPLAALPLGLAAAVWVVGKVVVLGFSVSPLYENGDKSESGVSKAENDWNQAQSRFQLSQGLTISILLIVPYLIEDFRYGNAQFYIVALTIASLLMLRTRPALSGASLALAISIKVWPAFFLPYLAVRREWKPIGYALAGVVMLAMLPSIYFGFSGNLDLLGQWFAQEFQTQLGADEIWFPNQSLRGVMMRYFTVIDYSQVPDSNYVRVNFLSLDPSSVRAVWTILAGAIYAAFLFCANKTRHMDGWVSHAVAFCLVSLLQPFTQKYALVMLLWPAIAAGKGISSTSPKFAHILIYGAVLLVLIQPLAPGANAQRFLQVLGTDFAATSLLCAALAVAWLTERSSNETLIIQQ